MSIVDLIFPKICVGCGREGEYICKECQQKLIKPESICPTCCKPSIDGWVHARCKQEYGMDRLVVGLPYKGMVQQCLKKVKYKSAYDIISFLFHNWRENCSDMVSQCHDGCVVTPVPMWKQKERERGFNQAAMFAELLREHYKVPNLVMLERVRETRPMFGLEKKERKENVEGAFTVNLKFKDLNPKQIQNNNDQIIKQVILVDDVWTTGATMRECTKVLKEFGIKDVWGIALAR